jgi:hypothetical protein
MALRADSIENPLHGYPNEVARLPNYRLSRDLIVVNAIWVEKLIVWAPAYQPSVTTYRKPCL